MIVAWLWSLVQALSLTVVALLLLICLGLIRWLVAATQTIVGGPDGDAR